MTDRTIYTKRCCKTVYPNERYGSFHGHQCSNKGVIERNGKLYCTIHDPVRVDKQDKERQKKWDEIIKQRQAQWRRDRAMQLACEGVPTEVLEKIKVKDLLP